MDLTYNFLWLSGGFLLYLFLLIPIINNLITFIIIARKDNTLSKYSKLLFLSQIISLGLIIGSIFIPLYTATNINLNTDIPTIYGLGFLYIIIFVFPYVITQGITMTLFGIKRKDKYSKSLMTAGIMLTVYYLSIFFWLLFHGVIYVPGFAFLSVLSDWVLYNFMFIIFAIMGYIFFIKYNSKTGLKLYRNTGLIGIIIIISLETIKWFAFFNNIFIFPF